MRFSRYSFILLLFFSCRSEYKLLEQKDIDAQCSKLSVKSFSNQWYSAAVDVKSVHLSGLLLIKTVETGSDRVVFMSEAGITFFDFELFNDGSFKVHHIIDKMNKAAVIQTLRKDFELLLGKYFISEPLSYISPQGEFFKAYKNKDEIAYMICDATCMEIKRIELAGKGKKKVSVNAYPDFVQKTDSVKIQHHTFDMRIKLTPIEKQ